MNTENRSLEGIALRQDICVLFQVLSSLMQDSLFHLSPLFSHSGIGILYTNEDPARDLMQAVMTLETSLGLHGARLQVWLINEEAHAGCAGPQPP